MGLELGDRNLGLKIWDYDCRLRLGIDILDPGFGSWDCDEINPDPTYFVWRG